MIEMTSPSRTGGVGSQHLAPALLLLGGQWDLVIADNWAYFSTYYNFSRRDVNCHYIIKKRSR